MKRIFRPQLFRFTTIWAIIFSLSQFTFAQHLPLKNGIIYTKDYTVNNFLTEYEKLYRVKDLSPLVNKYIFKKSDRDFVKKQLSTYEDKRLPKLMLKDDMLTLNFTHIKKKFLLQLNYEKQTITFGKHTISIVDKSINQIKEEMEALGFGQSQTTVNNNLYEEGLNVLFPEAHAVVGLLIAIGLLSTLGAVFSSAFIVLVNGFERRCKRNFDKNFNTLNKALVNCKNDILSVSENSMSKKHTKTQEFIDKLKEVPEHLEKFSNDCEQKVNEFFVYPVVFSKKTCIDQSQSKMICGRVNPVLNCLERFKALGKGISTSNPEKKKLPIKIQDESESNTLQE